MNEYNATWICPSLCGCKIQMRAKWVQQPMFEAGQTIFYAWPVKDSISTMMLINACVNHQAYLTEDLPVDPYQGLPGYLTIPQNPNPEEKLFIRLYPNTFLEGKFDTCECYLYLPGDRFIDGSCVPKDNSHITKKCKFHLVDSDSQIAMSENHLKNDVRNEIVKSFPELVENELDEEGNLKRLKFKQGTDLNWSFDDSRILKIDLIGISEEKKVLIEVRIVEVFEGKNVEVIK